MTYFQTKNSNLGKFWRVLQRNMLVHFMALWSTLMPFGIQCGHFLPIVPIYAYIFPFWYVVPRKIWQPCSKEIYWKIQKNKFVSPDQKKISNTQSSVFGITINVGTYKCIVKSISRY
jgi:uncharacterized Tic20 family protein